MKETVFVCAAVGLLAACATTTQAPQVSLEQAVDEAHRQKIEAFQLRAEREERLHAISNAILAANADLCPRTRNFYGLAAATPEDYGVPRRDRQALREALGLDDRPTIMWVTEGLAADAAGVRKGDLITAVNGKDIGFGKGATRRVLREMNRRDEGLTLTLFRDGETIDAELTPGTACDYEVNLLDRSELNAYANGRAVFVTKGMMGFVESDEELALIIGHELAHNSENHMRSKQMNSMLGALAGAAIGAAIGNPNIASDFADLGGEVGASMFSQEFEAEADYVGLYFAGRAGYETAEAADLWRRMGVEHPSAIDLVGSSHPSTAMRFLSIEEAAKEFSRKRREGQALVPTRKSDEPAQKGTE